jgi:hypothetical protein
MGVVTFLFLYLVSLLSCIQYWLSLSGSEVYTIIDGARAIVILF